MAHTDNIITTTTGGTLSVDPTSWYVATPAPPQIHVIDKQPTLSRLVARTRINKPTLSALTPNEIISKVRSKLTKELLEQLLNSKLIKIESVTNPKNGSVTFTASIEAAKQEDEPSETHREAA